MNGLRNVGRDTELTTEQAQFIRERAVYAARKKFIGRKLFGNAIRYIDSGTQVFGYDTLTEISNASLDFTWPGRLTLDQIGLARTTVAIPNLHKEAEIPKLDLSGSQNQGTPVNTTTIDSMGYKVALKEDSLLIQGSSADGTTYEINGLYQGAGNTDGTALDYGTKANIETSVNNGIALLAADNIYPPYNMTLNAAQHSQTLALVANTAVSYRQWINESLQGGSLYMSSAITAGTGMLSAADPTGAFEYVIAEDITTETEITSKKEGNNLFIRVYCRGLPLIYDSNAICTLTSI